MVLISAVNGNNMTVDIVQPLGADELAATQMIMGKLRQLCMRARGDPNETPKRNQTAFVSPPASVKKARTIASQPTDESLP